MVNILRNLRQVCTFWPQEGISSYGKPSFGSAITIPCRWEDKVELFIDKKGQEATSQARIFLVQGISVEGYLALGDQSAEPNPLALDSAFEVRQVKNVPDLRNLQNLITAWL